MWTFRTFSSTIWIYTVIKQPRYIQYLELIVHKLGQEGGHVAFEVLEPVEIEIVLNKQE